MPAVLSPRAEVMLDSLPPFEQGSWDMQAAMHALALEMDRFEASLTAMREGFWPGVNTSNFAIFETLLGLSVNPPDKTIEQRAVSILAFYRKLKSSGKGTEWQDTLTELIGTGWTYEEHIPGDVSTPPEGTLRLTIPFADPINPPTGFSATPSTTSGTLPAATYYYAVSAANFYGETPTTTPVSATLGATGRMLLSWTASTDASSYRVYRGTSPSTLKRLDTGSLLTATTYTDNGSATVTALVPTNTNQTGSFQSREARALARKITPAHLELIFGYGAGFLLGSSALGDVL